MADSGWRSADSISERLAEFHRRLQREAEALRRKDEFQQQPANAAPAPPASGTSTPAGASRQHPPSEAVPELRLPIERAAGTSAPPPESYSRPQPAPAAPPARPTAPPAAATPAPDALELPLNLPSVPASAKSPARASAAPRRARPTGQASEQGSAALGQLPQHIRALLQEPDSETAQHYYTKPFKESRAELIQRLLDPPLTLEETARVLNVCPMTVRRYTNRGLLAHYRTAGGQRRFRLSEVLAFLEKQGGLGEG